MQPVEGFIRDCVAGTDRLVILGAGSTLKADDAAGTLIADRLIEKYSQNCSERLRIYSGNTAPENYTGAVKAFSPGRLIIIDAADFGEAPGSVSSIDPRVIDGVSFSTHMLPLKILTDYLRRETGCETVVIGIQPQELGVGSPMSAAVKRTVARITKAFETALLEAGFLPFKT